MYFIKKIILVIVLSFVITAEAQEEVRLAFYNILNFPQAPPSNRLEILSAIIDDMQPDIFMIAELESENGGNDILNQSLQAVNTNYVSAPYFNNTSSGADLQQLLYFDASKFNLLETTIIPTSIRDINHYRLQTITDDSQIVEVFVSHLKASTGDSNEQLRLEMVQEYSTFIETIDPDSYIVFAGDLNLYSSEEPAYQELLDPTNAIVLRDPIDTPGNWNNNSNFADVHTQSTRISSDEFDDFGAGGGLDSRFDFILLSDNFFNEDATLQYINASYKSYGNNGNCFNNRLDDSDCDGEYNNTVRNLLYQMSDHLPVVADISVSGNFLSTDVLEVNRETWRLDNSMVKDVLNIAFAKAETQPSQISVYDQTGRLIKTEVLQSSASVDVSFLSNGLYFVTSENPEWPTLKFIKTH